MNTRIIKKLKEEPSSTIDNSLVLNANDSSAEEDEMTKRKNEAMEKALRIPHVVEQIIEELKDFDDLKACRRVNQTWMDTINKIMTSRDLCQIKVSYDNSKKFRNFANGFFMVNGRAFNPIRGSQEPSEADDLNVLTKLFENSTHFPCSTFVIINGDLKQLVEFFQIAGDHIKSLKLYKCSTTTNGDFREILETYCPNLEKLQMEKCPIYWSAANISYKVPKLKILSMDYYNDSREHQQSPFKILQILIFPNLKSIQGFDVCRDLEFIIKAGKSHCVKELKLWDGRHFDELTKFDMFVGTSPRLELLNLNLWSSFKKSDEKMMWTSLVQKLLELSQDTLKVLNFKGIEVIFNDLNFPKCSRLTEIEIESERSFQDGTNGEYPYEILEPHISPNLKLIKGFNLRRDTEAVLGVGRIDCVKELDYRPKEPKDIIEFEKFVKARPQLETLYFFLPYHFEGAHSNFLIESAVHMEQLLELSKDTLKILHFGGVGTIFQDLKFPKFPQLKEIKIEGCPVRIFPRGINLPETLPNLNILDLSGYHYIDNFFPPPNESVGCLTSVKRLIVLRKVKCTLEHKLRLMFPNAQLYTQGLL